MKKRRFKLPFLTIKLPFWRDKTPDRGITITKADKRHRRNSRQGTYVSMLPVRNEETIRSYSGYRSIAYLRSSFKPGIRKQRYK